MENIVILGNGAAGLSAAETIRTVNGEIGVTIVSHVDGPAYSPCALPDWLAGSIDKTGLFINDSASYCRLGIKTCFGQRVLAIDPANRQVTTDQETILYDKLIFALGSGAIVPPVPGSVIPGNFVVKSIQDVEAILDSRPRQVAVIGSGNVGIEVAQALHHQGCRVIIVEMMDRVLPRLFDEVPSRQIEGKLKGMGIEIYLGEQVKAVCGDNQVEGLITTTRKIDCEAIIWAVGVQPNVEVAKQAGIGLGSLGAIQVNEYMQTNVAHVYAAGDCVESKCLISGRPTRSPLWPNAKRQGQIAALNCLGQRTEYEGSVTQVTEDIGGLRAVSMGLTNDQIQNQPVEVLEGNHGGRYWRLLLADDMFVGMQTLGINEGLGFFMNLLKKRTSQTQLKGILSDTDMLRTMSWYVPALQFID